MAFAVPLALYVASLRGTVAYWDTGELQTVPYILGIAHPSGFPAYVLIGWVWSHAVPFGDPAYRMDLLSAVAMAGAALALAGALIELTVEPVTACGAALVFAVTRVPWDHATHADVHPLALAAIGASFWAALRWGRSSSRHALAACAGAAALALAVHSGMVLVVPGIALAAFARRPTLRQAAGCFGFGRADRRLRSTLTCRCAARWFTRSGAIRPWRWGCRPGGRSGTTTIPAGWAGFKAEVGGGDFGTGHALARLVDPAVIARLPAEYGEAAVGDLAGGVMLLALIGAFARDPPLAGGRLGSSSPARCCRCSSCWPIRRNPIPNATICHRTGRSGCAWERGRICSRAADFHGRRGRWARSSPARCCLSPSATWRAIARAFFASADDSAQRFIDRIVRETPPDAIIVAPWMYATPLAYAAYVQRRLGDRIVVTGWPNDYVAYYPAWLAGRRPIRFVSDDPALIVAGLHLRERDLLTPAPHLFSALSAAP